MNGEEGLSKVSEVGYTKPLNRLELSDKCGIISLLTTYPSFYTISLKQQCTSLRKDWSCLVSTNTL